MLLAGDVSPLLETGFGTVVGPAPALSLDAPSWVVSSGGEPDAVIGPVPAGLAGGRTSNVRCCPSGDTVILQASPVGVDARIVGTGDMTSTEVCDCMTSGQVPAPGLRDKRQVAAVDGNFVALRPSPLWSISARTVIGIEVLPSLISPRDFSAVLVEVEVAHRERKSQGAARARVNLSRRFSDVEDVGISVRAFSGGVESAPTGVASCSGAEATPTPETFTVPCPDASDVM